MQETAQRSFSEQSDDGFALWGTLAREEFNELERWLNSDGARCLSLNGVECSQERRGRELMRLLLQAHVASRGNGYVGPAIEVSEDEGKGVWYEYPREHVRHIVTVFGKISVKRVGYRREGKRSIHPLDEDLQLPGRGLSYEIQRRLVKKAIQGPFDETVEALNEATQVKVPKRIAEEIVIEAGRDFDDFYARRKGNGKEETGPILVGAIDCKGIPMVKLQPAVKKVRRRRGEKAQKKRMATVAAVFTKKRYVRTPEEVVASLFRSEKGRPAKRDKDSRPERKRVWASLKAGKDAFIGAVHEEMIRRDPRHRKYWVVVTDGERALQKRVCLRMKDVVLVLDLLHVLEKLWAAGHALYGEGSVDAEKFVQERALRILQGQVSQVIKGMRQMATKRSLKGKKAKTVRGAAAYFYNNRSRMRYDEYLAEGLPIASGSVEGACKNLIKDRMERSGMRWSETMAEAMVKIRATYLSGDFEEYWQFHISRDQERLYPHSGQWKPLLTLVEK